MARRDERPDPRLMWRFIGDQIRPWAGWAVTIGGVIAMAVGYFGVSREVLVAKQLPFLVSGGLGGLALVFLGSVLLGTHDVREQGRRLEELEELVDDLHAVLLTAEVPGTDAGSNGHGAGRVAALPTGTTYHALDCSLVQGRDDAERLSVAAAADRGLTACKRCQPAVETAAAGAE